MITYTPPGRAHADSPTYTCRWQSNRMPYVFKFSRRDDEHTVSNSSGFVQLDIIGTTIITDDQGFAQGSIGTQIVLFFGTRIVTGNIVSVGIVPTLSIVTDIPFLASYSATCFVNYMYLKNFRLYFTMLYLNPLYVEPEPLAILEASFDPKGEIELDVRTILEHNMNKINENPFIPETNVVDSYKYIGFLVRYKTKYIESGVTIESAVVNDDFPYHAIDGAKRLQEKYGANFAEYETNPNGQLRAKFLTRFPKPVYFNGYPFSLSYIFGGGLSRDTIELKIRELKEDGTQTSLRTSLMFTDLDASVQQVTLHNSATLNLGTTQAEVWLLDNDLAASSQQITEKKIVRINNDCRKAPLYLMWKNTLGGWDFWLFDNKHEITYGVRQDGVVSLDPYDTEFALYREKIIGADMTKTLTLGDVVSKENIDALAEIEVSPQVYLLTNPTYLGVLSDNNEFAWTGVTIVPSGTKYQSEGENIQFEIKIKLPDIYTTSN